MNRPRITKQLDRFFAKVRKTEGCWLWTGGKARAGYGAAWDNHAAKLKPAHKLSYLMFKGDVPPGWFVCHKCDVPACVNPDHLFLGTPQDNVTDMQVKGRGTNVISRQQREDVRKEYRLFSTRRSNVAELAAKYGVSKTTIHAIVHYTGKYGKDRHAPDTQSTPR